MGNANLLRAKKAKNDEFYTRYEDIEEELKHYDVDNFKGKVIYCPCDMPSSNFVKYFEANKDRLQYKELIHTSIQEGYDFRDERCAEYFNKADVVVTNPPFSLFKEFLEVLVNKKLNYLILGSNIAVLYKETFLLIKNNQLRLGYTNVNKYQRPDNTLASVLTYWFTNFDVIKQKQPILLVKSYNEQDYQKYDNYDAIEVSKVKDIPCDYYGLMGVPISFLSHYNPDQFEIIGMGTGVLAKELGVTKNYRGRTDIAYTINGVSKCPFSRILIRRKQQEVQ